MQKQTVKESVYWLFTVDAFKNRKYVVYYIMIERLVSIY